MSKRSGENSIPVSAGDVQEWLAAAIPDSVEEKAAVLAAAAAKALDGPALRALGESELNSVLGLKKFGPRRKLFLRIADLSAVPIADDDVEILDEAPAAAAAPAADDDADADMTGGDAPPPEDNLPSNAPRDDGEDLAPIDEAHVVREMERYIAEVERAQAARAPGPREPPVTRPNDPTLETSEDACAWEGGVDEIVDHLVHCHGVHVERSRDVLDDGVRYLLEDTEGSGECTWGPWLARDAAGRAYLLRVEQRNGAIFAAGQLVASDEESRRAADDGLVLKLTAFSPKRNVSYESPPTSLRSDFRHLRRTGDGLWLSRGQVQLLGERPPTRGRPPPPGAKPVRLTLWFEIVGAGDGDDASLEGTNATHYADETRGARCDTDADLERALAPMHVSAAREADDAAAAPKRGELA